MAKGIKDWHLQKAVGASRPSPHVEVRHLHLNVIPVRSACCSTRYLGNSDKKGAYVRAQHTQTPHTQHEHGFCVIGMPRVEIKTTSRREPCTKMV